MKKIKTKFKKKDNKDDHWKFDFEDEDSDVFPPVIIRNQPIEIETEDWNVPIQAVKLSNFRAFAVVDVGATKRYKEVQDWGDLYVAIAGSGTTHLTLDLPADNEFLVGGARENDHRLIEFSAEIFLTDGNILEIDPIIDERPT